MSKADNDRLPLPPDLGSSLPTGATKLAVGILGRRIANDIFNPSEVMPTESELAEMLGVSRATIRDAIKVLSGKGMVRTARRYGTRVRPVEEWNLLDSDVVSWHEPTHPRLLMMFVETTELRYIIEPAAAALAAERASDEQMETLLSAAHALHPEKDETEELFAADCRFHATLLEATGNLMMRQLRPLILTMLRILTSLVCWVAATMSLSPVTATSGLPRPSRLETRHRPARPWKSCSTTTGRRPWPKPINIGNASSQTSFRQRLARHRRCRSSAGLRALPSSW